jgi:ribosome-binding protein aMBF1 (putative translation factor)
MVAVVSSVLVAQERSRSRGRQEHPKGPLRTVDDVVRDRVRVALTAKGWDQKDLAAKINVVPATITNLLKPGPPRQIKFLPQLFAALDLDDDLERIVRNWPGLSSEDKAVIVALVAARSSK